MDKITSLINFQSNRPEEIIKNIKNLHSELVKYINQDNHDLAKKILNGEIQQYNRVIELFSLIGLSELVDLSQKKLEKIQELLYKVHTSDYIRRAKDKKQDNFESKI